MFSIVLEKVVNEALRSDRDVADKLFALAGKCVGVCCGPVSFYFLVGRSGVQVSFVKPVKLDTRISVNLAFVLQSVLKQELPFESQFSVDGNIAVAQVLSQVLSDLRVDWGQVLAPVFGVAVSRQMVRGLQAFFVWGRQVGVSKVANWEEYLTEEWRVVPARGGFEGLVEDVEGLEKRVGDLSLKFKV